MKLNCISYVHVLIRQLCFQLEQTSGLRTATDLSKDFKEIRFENDYSYIIIDYRDDVCFTLSHKLTEKEMAIIKDIVLHLQWLEIGIKYCQERIKNK